MQFIAQPFGEVRLGEFLLNHLCDPHWTAFRAAIAFVKRSGTQHILPALHEFSARAHVRISVGIDLYGTSREGLIDLLEATKQGQIFIYRNNGPFTFHPKVYLFKSMQRADVLVGSGNLTGGGLFTNYEASLAASLDLNDPEDLAFLQTVEATLDSWSQPQQGLCYQLTAELLDQLVTLGFVRSEAQLTQMQQALVAHQQPPTPQTSGGDPANPTTGSMPTPSLFLTFPVPPAPAIAATATAVPVSSQVTELAPEEAEAEEIVAAAVEAAPTFVISVLTVDLPVPGSSNEVTITKHIRNVWPEFWGWPTEFAGPDPMTGQYRRNVHIRYGDHLINAYLIDFPGRKPDGTKASADFRMGSIAPIVADLQQEDDLIVLTRSTEPNVDYVAQVIRVHDAEHEQLMDGMQVYSRSRSANGTYRKFRYIL
jgi:HKD family nuclease